MICCNNASIDQLLNIPNNQLPSRVERWTYEESS